MHLFTHYLRTAKQGLSWFFKFSKSSTENQELSSSDLENILMNWEISQFKLKKNLRGSSATNFLLETPEGKYVLRGSGSTHEYVEFQIFIMNQLTECNFGYLIPQPLEAKGAYYLRYRDRLWLLYRYIEGKPLRAISTTTRAKEMGVLVASYHKIVQGIDYNQYKDFFTLQLFDTKATDLRFQESIDSITGRRTNRGLENLFIKNANAILEAYNNIPNSDIESIKKLPQILVYNDWNGCNILGINDKIVGLIDFDSVVEAPRIVDFQNALIYAMGTNKGINISRMQSFIQGYLSILHIPQFELSLIYPLMIDRLTCLISELLEERRRKLQYNDRLTIFFINLLIWLIRNKDEFMNRLFEASSQNNNIIMDRFNTSY